MYLLDLAMRTLASPSVTAPLQSAQRFRVTGCEWLKGRIIRWSPGGVTVKFDIPNQPFEEDGQPPADDAITVGNYSGCMCISSFTEVTEV